MTVGTAWRLHAEANNTVYTDGERWMKVPRSGNPFAHQDLDMEAAVWAVLGVATERDGSALIVPDRGSPIVTMGRGTVTLMISEVLRLAGMPAVAGSVTMRERTFGKVLARGSRRAQPWVPEAEVGGIRRLVHGDPQLSNWVLSAEGPSLIDWESAVAGAPDQALGILWVCLAKTAPSLVSQIEGQVVERSGFLYAARCKIALLLSYMEWRPGPNDVVMLDNLRTAVGISEVFEAEDLARLW